MEEDPSNPEERDEDREVLGAIHPVRSGGELTRHLHTSETEASFTYTPDQAEGETPGTMVLFQEKGTAGAMQTLAASPGGEARQEGTAGCWELPL